METEKKIEQALINGVRELRGECYKWMSPGRAGVPDRICVLPGGIVYFIEVKDQHKKLNSKQKRELERLRIKGQNVFVICNLRELWAVFELMKEDLYG